MDARSTALADGDGSLSWYMGRRRFDGWLESRIRIDRPRRCTDSLCGYRFDERARAACTGSDGMVARTFCRRRHGPHNCGYRRVCNTCCAIPAGAKLPAGRVWKSPRALLHGIDHRTGLVSGGIWSARSRLRHPFAPCSPSRPGRNGSRSALAAYDASRDVSAMALCGTAAPRRAFGDQGRTLSGVRGICFSAAPQFYPHCPVRSPTSLRPDPRSATPYRASAAASH